VHFHYFFRELHQRLNAQPALTLPEVLAQMTDGCRLLCFDEFHLHDPGDAMLVKALLTLLFQRGIILLATSNYPRINYWLTRCITNVLCRRLR
jgi:cell division protein ZapE